MNATTNKREGVRSGPGRRAILLFLVTSGLLAMAAAPPALAHDGHGGGGGGRGEGRGDRVLVTCDHGPGHVCGPACNDGRSGGHAGKRGPKHARYNPHGPYFRGWTLGRQEGAEQGYRDGLRGRRFGGVPFGTQPHRLPIFRKGYREGYETAYGRAFERGRDARRRQRHARHGRHGRHGRSGQRGWSVTWRW